MDLHNTQKILIIVLMSSFITCTNVFIKSSQLLVNLDDALDFNIEIKELSANPVLIFNNVSNDTLTLTRPNCVGRNVWPKLIDSDGFNVSGNRIKADCNYDVLKLLPGKVISEVYNASINDCFDIDSDSNYNLYFEYQADVFDKKGNLKIRYKILKSKKIKICKGSVACDNVIGKW